MVTGASSNPFQYTGRENDGTGLYYYRARYYSQNLHRFISEDPIGLRGGVHFYRYVENNPLGFTDPFGLDKRKKGCSAGGQSTTVTNIAVSGTTLTVDLLTEGFPPGSTVGVDVNTGSLMTDQNPAGQNKVNFSLFTSNSSQVRSNGTVTVQLGIGNLPPGQYVQIVPQRLKDPYAPVITPIVSKIGQIVPCANCRPETTYDSKCQ